MTLEKRRILIIEDEHLIASDLADTLADLGAEVLLPMPTVEQVFRCLAAERERPDAAVIDVNLNGEASWPVVDQLVTSGVPVVLMTGYSAQTIPTEYAHLPIFVKPSAMCRVTRLLEKLCCR
jgi:DNA-binding response OmpR family regulator